MESPVIRSFANPVLKRVRKAHAGREAGVLVLEGDRLIEDALTAGFELEVVLVDDAAGPLAERWREAGAWLREIEPELLERVSALETSPGSLALVKQPEPVELERLAVPGALLLVVAGVSDPGNLGALARSAEAAGVTGLVVAGGVSPWNGKALRGSMGSLLRVPVCERGATDEVARELDERGVRGLVAATRGGADHRSVDWGGAVALWVGAETGDGPDTGGVVLEPVTIAMEGRVESLNVAVATSILLFEAAAARRGVG